MLKNSLPYRNCVRRPGRTTALIILSLFLCFTIMAGSLLITGLKSGLDSLESRLGADLMVVPYEAATKSELSNMILQGNPGYFYMDKSVMAELGSIEGVERMSEQFYLASASASCCSYKVQLIGFNPDTDFAIAPWVKLQYDDNIEDMEAFVGSDLNSFPGDKLKFYGSEVTVAAKLDKTGTYVDTAIYANEDTIKTLITSAKEKKIFNFGDVDPDEVVSCVLIDVADGYTAEDVMNDINLHIDNIEAVQTQNMVSDVSGKLDGISGMAGGLIIVVWVLVFVIMMLAFAMISNERKKEFAILRVIGSSRKHLAMLIIKETLMISVTGSVAGVLLGMLTVKLFSSFIENTVNLPFLLPGAGGMILLAIGSVLFSVIAASLASAMCAARISKVDAAIILRGDN